MKIDIVPVTLSYRYFGPGPGMGGVAELAVAISAGRIKVRLRADATDPADSLEMRKTLRANAGWRKVVDLIVRESWEAFNTDGIITGEYPWPDKMEVEGPESLFVELVALSWAGPPVAGIAQALSSASDEQLVAFRESAGPLTGRRFLRQMLKIDEHLDGSLRDVVAQMHPDGFDLSAIRRGARAYAALAQAKGKTDEAKQAWAILGFEDHIERIIDSWRRQNIERSANGAIGRGVQAKALKDYLREFVGRHRALPSGSQTLTAKFGSSSHQFKVNFDLVAK